METPSSAEEVIAVAERALRLAPAKFTTSLPTQKELRGAADWYPFERAAWAMGEHIRHAFLNKPSLRSQPEVLKAIVKVIAQTHLRRGRQSFVMLLGTVKAAHLAPQIALFLSDTDIEGHVVDTLTKMRAGGYSVHVKKHLGSKYAWIRNKAKRYVERFAV